MTTRAAHLPVGDIRISAGTAVTILIAALAAMTAILLMAARGGGEVQRYESSLAPLIERHNSAVADWNQFVTKHNATAVFSLGTYDAQSADANAQVDAIALEMDATTALWAGIVPPPSHAVPHGLVLEAMQLTLEGVTGVATYFDAAAAGEGDYLQAQQSLAMIDEASIYWAQAKSFEG